MFKLDDFDVLDMTVATAVIVSVLLTIYEIARYGIL